MQENLYPIAEWSLAKKIAFRFIFVYLVLYNLPFPCNIPLNVFPFTWLNMVGALYQKLLLAMVPWVGKNILQIDYSINAAPTGSGDRTFDYVAVFCFLVLATFSTVIWTLFDRKRTNYDYLHTWLRAYVRYSLASVMIGYGAYKVIKVQFPNPSLSRLIEPFGEASPMGLVWTFMGFSEPYNVFTGGAEVLGGILLVAPQITTLGALVCIGVMSNVFMLNMSYDIPVKLYSFHLMMMAVFLVAPDLKRLYYLFILNSKVEGAILRPLFQNPWLNRGAATLGIIFISVITISSLLDSYGARRSDGDLRQKPPLYGIWVVDEFEVDGEIKPPLITDKTRWRRVIFDFSSVFVQNMDEKRDYINYKINMEKKTLEFNKYGGEEWKANFSFQQPDIETMIWQGKLNDKPAQIKLHRLDETKFLLNSRGFNWINEYPYNR